MTPVKRLRRPSAGGYARGDETRERIIEAAVKLFGERGFGGASTRDIAAAAGVNAPALQYYFENKEGLYQACAESITRDLIAHFDPVMKQARAALKNGAGTDVLIETLLAIHAAMLDRVLMQSNASAQRLFLARELAGEEPPVASKLLSQQVKQPFYKVATAMLSRISGIGANDPVTRIRLLTLKGQMMPFYHPSKAGLEELGWKEIDAAKAALIKTTVLEQMGILMRAWAQAR